MHFFRHCLAAIHRLSTRQRRSWHPGRWLVAMSVALLLPARGLDNEKLLEAAAKLGPRAVAEAPQLQQLIERAAGQDEERRINTVNNFFNRRIEYREDIDNWGVADYWASPLESLNKGKGDCEDYAIAKYFTLVAAGMPVAKLRIVWVRALVNGAWPAHMVLAYYAQPGSEPLILDNLQTEVKPASQRSDLRPGFSFNTEGLWKGVGSTTDGNPLVRLSIWRELVAKVQAEGF